MVDGGVPVPRDPGGLVGVQLSARGIYRRRTDWFRVLVDLQYEGVTHKRVADVLGVGMSTVLGWKAGSEPNHHDGHRLLEMWCEQFNRLLSDRPMTP